MRIDFDLLRSNGFEVRLDTDEETVDIYPVNPSFQPIQETAEILRNIHPSLTVEECQALAGQMFRVAQGREIVNLCITAQRP